MMLDRVQAYIRDNQLLDEGARVLVGLSGGVDSVVLTHVLQRLGMDVVAAHVNYGLRDAADDDETFVRQWCANQEPPVPLQVAHLNAGVRAAAFNQSVQEAARDLRYDFFERVAEREDISRVAVGHHRGDQAETLLLNLFRGTGPEGLAGMPPRRSLGTEGPADLIRPLLCVAREEIEAYAQEHELEWRVDESNMDPSYQRAALRTEILPQIEERFDGATDRIAHAAELMRTYLTTTWQDELEDRFELCSEPDDEGGKIDVQALRMQPAVWRRRIVLEALSRWLPGAPYTSSVAEEIESLLDAQVGRRIELASGTVWRERGCLRLVQPQGGPSVTAPQHVSWNESVELPTGTLRVEVLDTYPDELDAGTPFVVYADADRIEKPMRVRTWHSGDRFKPLGMTNEKKISDFLTDEQVPPHQRRGVLVLSANGEIAWVIGHRLAHDVRVRPDTETIARLSFLPHDEDIELASVHSTNSVTLQAE